MEFQLVLTCLLFSFHLHAGTSQSLSSGSVSNCCEGDVLFLLDSSGSVSMFEFSHMLNFLSELMQPFSLGPDQVRMALLQVSTKPHLEFGFEAYTRQQDLQVALQRTQKLGGDTNTNEALLIAKEEVLKQGIPGGAREGLPRVLVWLTDGVQPGNVQQTMAELRDEGVYVLTVSTGQGNYQVLRDVVSPPIEDHLHFVDIEDMNIITEDLRNAIIEIIRAKRLQVQDITPTSAVLHWRPVFAGTGYYDIRFGPIHSGHEGDSVDSGTDQSKAIGHYQRITRPPNSSSAKLSNLRPDTTYNVTLIPHSNLEFFNTLHATFTTHPEIQSPAQVTVSESTMTSVRLSWGPLQPDSVQTYQVEYSTLPTGKLHVLTVNNRQNSTVLTNLQPGTQYLVTVSASYFSGKEKAMSVKACTQEVLPALADLHLTMVGNDSVLVKWKGGDEGLRGYWLTWEGESVQSSRQRSTLYLPPHLLSTTLTHVPHNARVCVSPVYKSARGEGLCCTAHFRSAAFTWNHNL
ncbi:von Willebrand factor A domain-containing protein 1 [Neoarius graeffei]|uniref:von Willebrand factor A domain-containing protein 1 n=1 Tax=Neoarius graeffei TaxID=443677 RepID=UPI00298BD1DF|nr:von Willebrand factor A domain-containing protein 1 [Neoarius graeffei]XP_060794327.1 von Willebrand factor A domain-containing protein 1 [Neoarius graeffei]